jgi:hypothetical protein
MSVRRSDRLAAAPSKHTQESVQPAGTQKPKRNTRQSSGTKSTGPAAQPSRSRSRAKRPRAIVEDSDDGDEEDEADDDGSIVVPAEVKRPVIKLVSPALAAAWRVNRKQEMCFIFDAVSPARRFKRGMVFDEKADFPKDTRDGNITETDGPGPGWMPVDPGLVRCVWNHFTPHIHTNPTWHAG